MKRNTLCLLAVIALGLMPAYAQDKLVEIDRIYPKELKVEGFVLDLSQEIKIEAAGVHLKQRRDEMILGTAWILNAQSRETISLPAGKYAAIFVTDDSHSPYEWNSPPPHDPSAWGMFIRAAESDKRFVKKFEYNVFEEKDIILSLAPVRDDDFHSQGFTLKKPMKLRIYAIGEGSGKDLADYGWIVEAKTQKKVWEMRYYDTEHAGGAHKNRMQDEIVQLEAGSYMASFVTDDSHAHREWNSSPPYDPEHWGLTILAAEANFSRSDVAEYKPSADPSMLASIVGVRDHANKRASFTLKKRYRGAHLCTRRGQRRRYG
jgi:hypothetical protein